MAINKNHEFDELNGIKCAVVEKNVSAERVAFIKSLLELNKFTVVVGPSPPPKVAAAAPKPATAEGTETTTPPPVVEAAPPAPETFTVGVTNVSFNVINAIFGRLLKTKDNKIVTLAYWKQQDAVSHDEVPYFGKVF
jgi:hypothetical protein